MTPHLVLVHGAWHGSWCWDAVRHELLRRGVTSQAVDLPGPGRATGRADLRGQAQWLERLVAGIPRDVVLVGHSYGGQVVSEASPGLTNVVGLVYVAAFLARAGESCRDINESGPTPSGSPARELHADGEVLLALDGAVATATFYDDCPADVAARACARLTPELSATVRAPLVREGWREHPTRYVVCTRDKVLHPAVQERLSARADASVHLPSGHSPMLSVPAALADALGDGSWSAEPADRVGSRPSSELRAPVRDGRTPDTTRGPHHHSPAEDVRR